MLVTVNILFESACLYEGITVHTFKDSVEWDYIQERGRFEKMVEE